MRLTRLVVGSPDITGEFAMWECLKCGELVDSDFEVCWNCGASVSGEEDPEFRKADEFGTEEESSPAQIQSPEVLSDETSNMAPQASPVLNPRRDCQPSRSITPPELFCPRCGSHRIIPLTSLEVMVPGEHRGVLEARVDTDPDAWIMKGRTRSKLTARVCGNCGHTEIYASDPEQLWQAYQAQQQRHDT